MHNLFSLPCLLAIQTKGKEPLVDCSQSHVVTSYHYLDIVLKKAIDKTISKKSKDKTKGEK